MLTELILEVYEELTDPWFRHRKHYSRSTYKGGCRGPLCTKSERDKRVRRYAVRKPTRIAKERNGWEIARDNYLEEVIEVFGLRSETQAQTERLAELALKQAENLAQELAS